jgi:prepilin-type N-terminal cleavage/methylation domain-containing protein
MEYMQKKKLSIFNFQFSTQSGLTLIELLTSISIMAIISTFSIASFVSYSNSQTVQTAAADVVDTLNLAKSRAVSQVIDNQCTGKSLTAYQVTFTVPDHYALEVVCDGTTYQVGVTKVLAKNVTFKSVAVAQVVFNAGTGIVPNPGSIVMTGYNLTKTITVTATGVISVE